MTPSAREVLAEALEKAGLRSMATVYRSALREGTPDFIEVQAYLAGVETYADLVATQRAQQVLDSEVSPLRGALETLNAGAYPVKASVAMSTTHDLQTWNTGVCDAQAMVAKIAEKAIRAYKPSQKEPP